MIPYTLALNNQGDANPPYQYTLDLNPYQEDHPEQIFTPEIRKDMRQKLQRESSCAITDHQLDTMIRHWIEEIREGYRNSTISLNLHLAIDANFQKLADSGYQEIPSPIAPNWDEIEPVFDLLPPLEILFNDL